MDTQLALLVVQESFGEPSRVVVECLLKRPRMSLTALLETTKLPYSQLRECLLSLISQNIVYFISPTDNPSHPNAEIEYSADKMHILMRPRFPRFSLYVRERYGENAQMVFDEFLKRGQCTRQEAISQVKEYDRALSGGLKTPNEEACYEQQLREEFERIVSDRFIIQLDEVLNARNKDAKRVPQPKVRPRRGPKRARRTNSPPPTVIDDDNGDTSAEEDGEPDDDLLAQFQAINDMPVPQAAPEPAPTQTTTTSTAAAAGGPKPDAQQKKAASALESLAGDEGMLWIVNTERFLMAFRHDAIVTHARERLNETIAQIVAAVLQVVSPSLQRDDRRSQLFTEDELASELVLDVSPEGKGLTRAKLTGYMKLLCNEPPQILSRAADLHRSCYVLNVGNVVDALQTALIESIIHEQFDRETHRIFRILCLKKQLEEKQVAELAMLPNTEARKRLYHLMSQSLTHLQEVPKTADHAPKNTYYLWSVSLPRILPMMLAKMHRTLYNLHRRYASEYEQYRILSSGTDASRLVARPTDSTMATSQGGPQGGSAEDQDAAAETLTYMGRNVEYLEGMMARLDGSVMILRDY